MCRIPEQRAGGGEAVCRSEARSRTPPRAVPSGGAMAQRTLIKGGTVISVDPAVGDFDPGDVLIEEGKIVAVDHSIDAGDAEVIDATARIVMPGLIDTHRHTWQALFRNI